MTRLQTQILITATGAEEGINYKFNISDTLTSEEQKAVLHDQSTYRVEKIGAGNNLVLVEVDSHGHHHTDICSANKFDLICGTPGTIGTLDHQTDGTGRLQVSIKADCVDIESDKLKGIGKLTIPNDSIAKLNLKV